MLSPLFYCAAQLFLFNILNSVEGNICNLFCGRIWLTCHAISFCTNVNPELIPIESGDDFSYLLYSPLKECCIWDSCRSVLCVALCPGVVMFDEDWWCWVGRISQCFWRLGYEYSIVLMAVLYFIDSNILFSK